MKNGLLLGLDGAGKTLLLRQLAAQLLRTHKGLVDRIVALAQSASCMAGGSDGLLGTIAATGAAMTPPSIALPHLPFPGLGGSAGAETAPQVAPVGDAAFNRETQPTIGVEHSSLNIEGKTFSLCEVGGQLLPMWKAYFDASEFWIYVIDISSPAHVAGAAIEFFNIMRIESMRKKPKLIVLNKVDACFTLDDALLRSYLCLDRLLTDAFSPTTPSGPIHVVKVSSVTGENTDVVLKWISQRWHNNASSNGPNIGGPSTAHVVGGTTSARNNTFSRSEKQRVHPVAQ